jgi:cellulose synthase/poly-beta-1,6-N-acetylglucosamine synthase-like glycosyltransferase
MEYLLGIFLRKVFSMLNSIHVTPGPFSIYRKWFFDTYGGYDENNITEDIEIALRIQSHHYKIENCVDADVYTVSPEKFNALLNQRVRWYLGFTNNTINYKHLFRSRYGDLGLFILPAAFFSVFLVIISLLYFSYKSGVNIYQRYLDYSSIGFDFWELFEFHFDPFFINANSVALFGLLTFIVGVLVIYMSKLVAKEKTKIRYDYVFYLIAYWFLFGFWWIVSFGYKLLGKNIVWFNKKENG